MLRAMRAGRLGDGKKRKKGQPDSQQLKDHRRSDGKECDECCNVVICSMMMMVKYCQQ